MTDEQSDEQYAEEMCDSLRAADNALLITWNDDGKFMVRWILDSDLDPMDMLEMAMDEVGDPTPRRVTMQ